ncbi:MAG: rRNA maturation RNase YbeY [Bacteroidota bacterium]
MEAEINFFIEDVSIELPDKDKTQKWLLDVAKEEGQSIGALNFIFCSDSYLLDINKRYLQHFYYTDVITFQYHVIGNPVEGDCFISADTVSANAEYYQISFESELNRVMVHGLLHLLGYNDRSESESDIMKSKESYYLTR